MVMAKLCSATILLIVLAVARACPDFWTSFQESCYAFVQNPSTWAGAAEICREMNSNLVEVDTTEENTFLKSLLKSRNAQKSLVWIGGNDLLSENNWRWESGNPFSFTDWYPGQPDNADHTENCAQMVPSKNYQWNDNECYSRGYFICETRCIKQNRISLNSP